MQIVDKVLKESNRNKELTYFGVHPDGYIVDRRDQHIVPICNKPYFFLQQEIDSDDFTPKNARHLYRGNWLRHLTLTSDGRYYDYTIHQYFDSIFDWVEDCGCHIKDVLFGQNHTYKSKGKLICVGLLDLLCYIHGEYNWENYGVYSDEEFEHEEEEEEESDDEMPPLVPIETNIKNNTLPWFERLVFSLWIIAVAYAYYRKHEHSSYMKQLYLNSTLINSTF